jgi:hypothetical protein
MRGLSRDSLCFRGKRVKIHGVDRESWRPEERLESLVALWRRKMSPLLAVSIFPKYLCLSIDSRSFCGPRSEQLRTGTRFGTDIKTGIGSREVEFRAMRRLVVRSGGVARPLTAPPQRAPFPAVESVAVAASPYPRKCTSSVPDSTGNNRRGFGAVRLHGTP